MTNNQRDELRAWHDQARSGVRHKIDRMREDFEEFSAYDRVLDAVDDLMSENDELSRQVESQQEEIDDLDKQLEQKELEIAALRQQVLEARNEALEAEAVQKPAEIHNHFEQGCSAQVFNDKVTGKFMKKNKKEKRLWKKMARKM